MKELFTYTPLEALMVLTEYGNDVSYLMSQQPRHVSGGGVSETIKCAFWLSDIRDIFAKKYGIRITLIKPEGAY